MIMDAKILKPEKDISILVHGPLSAKRFSRSQLANRYAAAIIISLEYLD